MARSSSRITRVELKLLLNVTGGNVKNTAEIFNRKRADVYRCLDKFELWDDLQSARSGANIERTAALLVRSAAPRLQQFDIDGLIFDASKVDADLLARVLVLYQQRLAEDDDEDSEGMREFEARLAALVRLLTATGDESTE